MHRNSSSSSLSARVVTCIERRINHKLIIPSTRNNPETIVEEEVVVVVSVELNLIESIFYLLIGKSLAIDFIRKLAFAN